jgi:phenylpropionate dioxygenase-like ring-hydroxylating dioxygenase large terminal subunit
MTADLHLRALYDADAFAEEQARLGQVWTLVGYASDIPRENDWFRTVLGGRSIFIQRFAEGLRGFENRCAHRSYPLRTKERGNGPVICGFHNWRYNAEGNAVGIPNCPDAFGTTPAGLNMRLATLDVECCGDLIFARFPGDTESLAEFLGPFFAVLELICAAMDQGVRVTLPGRMNWRLSQWISMDDYHLAAVHPTSIPTGPRYLRGEELGYTRHGRHSAFIHGRNAGSIEDWVTQARLRQRPLPGYRIIHLFPHAGIAFIPFQPILRGWASPLSHLVLQRHLAVSVDRTDLEVTIVPIPHPHLGRAALSRLLMRLRWFYLGVLRRGVVRVLQEDQEVCENLQSNARQIAPDQLYGASEIRVAWFNEAYAEAMRADPPP